jgi:hypothetical protein
MHQRSKGADNIDGGSIYVHSCCRENKHRIPVDIYTLYGIDMLGRELQVRDDLEKLPSQHVMPYSTDPESTFSWRTKPAISNFRSSRDTTNIYYHWHTSSEL